MNLGEIGRFLNRQMKNFKVLLVERFLNSLFMGFRQYTVLFVTKLGADPMSLGYMNSAGLVSTIFISPLIGWLGDKHGLKKAIIIGRITSLCVPLIYAVAYDWTIVIPAIIITHVASRIHEIISFVMAVNSVRWQDRATALSLLNMIGRIASLITPIIGAYLVTSFGGISVQGIRPLFYIQILGESIILVFLILNLTENKITYERESKFFQDFKVVFTRSRPGLSRMLFLRSIGKFCYEITFPFTSLYAVEMKNATPYILGGMALAHGLGAILGSIPGGRLGDRLGRKKTIYLFRIPLYASLIIMILAPKPIWLILSQGLMASFWIGFTLFVTMTMELVDSDLRGRLNGLLEMFKSSFGALAPLLWGFLWTKIDPKVPYILMLFLDVLVMMPILYTIPETLTSALDTPKQ